MSGSTSNVAAVAGAGMLAAAIAVAAWGPRPQGEPEPSVPSRTRQVVVHTPEAAPNEPTTRPPELLHADALARAVDPAQWGLPDPLPDLAGTWCIHTTTSAWGRPAALRARETWSAGEAAGRFLRSGRILVDFDGVAWGSIDYEGALTLSPTEACITHSSSSWTPSPEPDREDRADDFEFAELNLRRHYASDAFRAGACQPLVRLDEDTVTVHRAGGFGHWLRCD
jgi:hypothetical protein